MCMTSLTDVAQDSPQAQTPDWHQSWGWLLLNIACWVDFVCAVGDGAKTMQVRLADG